jgi:hypothetical protein
MVCVHPCCGGPPPGCEPAPPGRLCPDGSAPVGPDECPFGCDAQECCLPVRCEPAPPYCVEMGALVCGGDPEVRDQCSVDDCYGMLEGTDLLCTCA